jgi:hypothetical protein
MPRPRNTFARFRAVTVFSVADFQNGPDQACVLGEPPQRFADIHSASLINAWYARLERALTRPACIEPCSGYRRVHVLGALVFDFYPRGNIEAWQWGFDANDRAELQYLQGGNAVIHGVPFDETWTQCYRLGAFHALCQRHPGQAVLCRAYAEWARRRLTALCLTAARLEEVRLQIAVALDLNVDLVAIASQVQFDAVASTPLRVDLYSQLLRYQRDLLQLQAEAPQLIPLYALMAYDLADFDGKADYEVTARMRALLLQYRIQPATWRLLCHQGSAWMHEFLCFFDFQRQSRIEVVVDLLLLIQCFGTRAIPPNWLLHALMQLGGNANLVRIRYWSRLNDLTPLCDRLGHLLHAMDEDTLVLLRDRAHDIFNWASDHLARVPSRTVRHASVQWLVRQVDATETLAVLVHQSAQPWHVPYQLDLSRWQVSADVLDSPWAVWQEGQQMHHCAAGHIAKCASGRWIMVSIRSAQHRHPLATMAFDMHSPKVQLGAISGFCNQLVGPEVHQLAAACRRQLTTQRKRDTLALESRPSPSHNQSTTRETT